MNKFSRATFLVAISLSFLFLPVNALFNNKQGSQNLVGDFEDNFFHAMSHARKDEIINGFFPKVETSSLLDEQGKKSLEILSLLPFLATLRTSFGSKVLHDLLWTSGCNRIEMQSRQTMIDELSKNDLLIQELDKAFDEIKQVEDDFLFFFEPRDEISEQVINQLYFGKRLNMLNNKPLALQLKQTVKYLYNGLMLIPPTIFSEIPANLLVFSTASTYRKLSQEPNFSAEQREVFANIYAQQEHFLKSKGFDSQASKKKFFAQLPLQSVKRVFRSAIDGHNPFKTSTNEVSRNLGDEIAEYRGGAKRILFTWACRGLMDLWWVQRIKSGYDALKTRDIFAKTIHTRVYNVARLLRAIQDVEKIVKV